MPLLSTVVELLEDARMARYVNPINRQGVILDMRVNPSLRKFIPNRIYVAAPYADRVAH